MVELGQRYRVKPEFSRSGTAGAEKMEGTVVYIHPRGRYAILAFKGPHGTSRESFYLDQLTDRNRLLEKRRVA